MNFGTITIIITFILTIASAIYYYLSLKNENTSSPSAKNEANIRIARYCFYASSLMLVIASAYLYYLIFNHKFQYSYVYRYSSSDLPFGYLLSTFWAGQEGSFLFWTFLIAIMGIVFIKTSQEYEVPGMVVINIIQLFFLAILIKASPFKVTDVIPPEGAGLNPLLQNPWMVIHPPVLFVGYAAISFPFALALSALIKKEHKELVSKSLPWALFSAAMLGAGIILGGFWAYVTLGWGGYWGWDPVENSSLIPWITVLALVHTLIAQRVTGSLHKSNFFLAIITFVLVLYATFLTRSGVLEDFSVHSFQNLGINLYLIVFIFTMLAIGIFIFFRRYRGIPNHSIDFSALNRENIILISLSVFMASAFLIFIGTSSPIFTGFMGEASQVDISFYNKVNLPIAIVMAFILGLAPFLRWKEKGIGDLVKSIIPSLILTVLSLFVFILFDINSPVKLLFLSTAAFALWSNTIVFIRQLRTSWRLISAPLSHIGVALMFIGIIVSGTLEKNQKVVLKKDIPTKVLDYEMVYTGLTSVSNGKDILNIKVEGSNFTYTAQPRFYETAYNQSMMREPDVRSSLLYDIYLSPLERKVMPTQSGSHNHLVIRKGETREYSGISIHFIGFDMGTHQQGGPMRIGAKIEVTTNDNKFTLTPALSFGQPDRKSEPAVFKRKQDGEASEVIIHLTSVNADQGAVQLTFEGLTQKPPNAGPDEQIILDVSKKPLINILWLGSIIMLVGILFAFSIKVKTA